jgi:hypothetical protein
MDQGRGRSGNECSLVQLKGQSPARDLNSQNCPLQGPSSLAQRSGRIVPSYDFCLRMRGGTLLLCMHKVWGTVCVRCLPPLLEEKYEWRIRRASTYILHSNIEENSSILRHYSPMLCKGLMLLLWTIESFHPSGMCKALMLLTLESFHGSGREVCTLSDALDT